MFDIYCVLQAQIEIREIQPRWEMAERDSRDRNAIRRKFITGWIFVN